MNLKKAISEAWKEDKKPFVIFGGSIGGAIGCIFLHFRGKKKEKLWETDPYEYCRKYPNEDRCKMENWS